MNIEKLKREQTRKAASVNSLKKEVGQLANEAKDLKDLILKRENNIKKHKNDEVKAKDKLDKLLLAVKDKQAEFNTLDAGCKNLPTKIKKLEKKTTGLQKDYDDKKEECRKQITAIDDKLAKKKEDAIKSFDKFKNGVEEEVTGIKNAIDSLKGSRGKLSKDNKELSNDNKRIEGEVEKNEKENKRLEGLVKADQLKVDKLADTEKAKKKSLVVLGEKEEKQKKEVKENDGKIKKQNIKLSTAIKKASFIVNKMEKLGSKEAYLKEVAGKMGLDINKI